MSLRMQPRNENSQPGIAGVLAPFAAWPPR